MTQNNLKLNIDKIFPRKRRGVAEVISTLLLVTITVVGAVILTTFIDESFVAGSLSVTSGTDTTIKTIKLWAYDTRDGENLMGYDTIDNDHTANLKLCRENCIANTNPAGGGSDFIVFQIENRSVNSVWLKNFYLDNVNHVWDAATFNTVLNGAAASPAGGVYPSDGMFSILPAGGGTTQGDREIESGETVNVLVKLHAADPTIPDIDLSKTMRVELNISEATLTDFLIETGDTR